MGEEKIKISELPQRSFEQVKHDGVVAVSVPNVGTYSVPADELGGISDEAFDEIRGMVSAGVAGNAAAIEELRGDVALVSAGVAGNAAAIEDIRVMVSEGGGGITDISELVSASVGNLITTSPLDNKLFADKQEIMINIGGGNGGGSNGRYFLEVHHGTGSGEYATGSQVTATATVPAGRRFVRWTVVGFGAHPQNFLTETISFIMPPNNVTLIVTHAPANSGKIFGVQWNKNESPTALIRLADSVGKTFSASRNGSVGHSDFDYEPIYENIRLCNVVNGEVTAWGWRANPNEMHDDSNSPNPFSRTPATGDVMVAIPKFYYSVEETPNIRQYFISDVKQTEDWHCSPAHVRPDGTERDYIFIGAYTCNSAYRSISGNASVVSITRATARTNCRNRGGGANGVYHQWDFATWMTMQLLYLVEVANWDSQGQVGHGIVSGSAQVDTGDSDGVNYHSGTMAAANGTTARRAVKYRHIENFWGNLWQWVDGININNRLAHICLNPAQYTDDTATNYHALGYTNAQTDGWISRLGYDPNYPFAQLPTAVTGSETTFVADHYWQGTGWRVLRSGGNWAYGSQCGVACAGAHGASTSAHTTVGCRLLVLP